MENATDSGDGREILRITLCIGKILLDQALRVVQSVRQPEGTSGSATRRRHSGPPARAPDPASRPGVPEGRVRATGWGSFGGSHRWHRERSSGFERCRRPRGLPGRPGSSREKRARPPEFRLRRARVIDAKATSREIDRGGIRPDGLPRAAVRLRPGSPLGALFVLWGKRNGALTASSGARRGVPGPPPSGHRDGADHQTSPARQSHVMPAVRSSSPVRAVRNTITPPSSSGVRVRPPGASTNVGPSQCSQPRRA